MTDNATTTRRRTRSRSRSSAPTSRAERAGAKTRTRTRGRTPCHSDTRDRAQAIDRRQDHDALARLALGWRVPGGLVPPDDHREEPVNDQTPANKAGGGATRRHPARTVGKIAFASDRAGNFDI